MFEFLEIKNYAEYNPLLVAENAPFTQAWFYGEWQEIMGRKVRRFEVKKNSEIIGFFQVIKYPLLFSQNFLYIPHGPVLTHNTQHITYNKEFSKRFYEKLLEIGKEENSVFVRFDSFPKIEENLSKYFKRVPPYAYHSSYFQPKFEWFVDLTKTGEEILSGIHPKNRYNIRLAEKRGVEIEIIGQDFKKYFDDFYRLLRETAKRDNFNLHPKNYYQNIFEILTTNNAFLVLAKLNNKILTINLILLFGETAYFVFGGSSDEYKNLMAPHLSHWQGIIEAKNRGCKFYNFGGVGPSTSLKVNNYDQFEGISRFKKRFGGELLEYSDSYDLILKRLWYFLYNLRKIILSK